MNDNPDWEYLYRMDERRIAELEAELAECQFQTATKSDKDYIAKLEAESRTRLDAQLTERHGRERAEAELAVQRELRRTDNAAGAKLDEELRAELAEAERE